MPVPKQRHCSSRGKRRRGGHRKLQKVSLSVCSNCAKEIQPHKACPFCGFYKGKKAIDTLKKVKKIKK